MSSIIIQLRLTPELHRAISEAAARAELQSGQRVSLAAWVREAAKQRLDRERGPRVEGDAVRFTQRPGPR